MNLNDTQLMALMQAGKTLDGVKSALPEDIQLELLKLEQRAGNAYASGDWKVEATGEVCPCKLAVTPPTVEEAQQVLGQAYLSLEDKKTTIKNVMNEMGLNPSAQRKSWVQEFADQISGWFK